MLILQIKPIHTIQGGQIGLIFNNTSLFEYSSFRYQKQACLQLLALFLLFASARANEHTTLGIVHMLYTVPMKNFIPLCYITWKHCRIKRDFSGHLSEGCESPRSLYVLIMWKKTSLQYFYKLHSITCLQGKINRNNEEGWQLNWSHISLRSRKIS